MDGTVVSYRDRARSSASRREPVSIMMKAPIARASAAMPRIGLDVRWFRCTHRQRAYTGSSSGLRTAMPPRLRTWV